VGWVDGSRRLQTGKFLFELLLLALSSRSLLVFIGTGYLEEGLLCVIVLLLHYIQGRWKMVGK
jgi:hypothetical protein